MCMNVQFQINGEWRDANEAFDAKARHDRRNNDRRYVYDRRKVYYGGSIAEFIRDDRYPLM